MQYERYRKAYEAYLLGERFDPKTADGQAVIGSLQLVADESGKKAPYPVPYESPTIHLRALAMAYRTPGSTYYDAPETLKEIERTWDAVKAAYNMDTCGEDFSNINWWVVQVGDPLRILDAIFLLYDILPNRDETIREWTDVILHHQDMYSSTNHGNKETGANLMWKCHVYILLGILREEQEPIDWAKEQLPTMLRYSRKISHPRVGTFYDDGFYPDGSFIQHYFTAYTGGYGKHLLSILSGLLYAFRDTDLHLLDAQDEDFVCNAVLKTYAPCMVDGRFLDIVRGREVCRWFFEDRICGRYVLRSLCYLACALPKEKTAELRGLLKLWLSKGDTREKLCVDESGFAEYYVYPSLPEVLAKLDSDPAAMAAEQKGHYNFGPMSKTVHRHGGWTAAVSMLSKTTACYEYLAGESATLWHISDGVTYLYTSDRDQYNGDYYATADMQRLPGTTVDRSPDRASDPYYSWFMPDSKNPCAFAGGASMGSYGIAGMQILGQGRGKTRDLAAKKSWFFLGEEIVCLGSGITSPSGDPIETTVLNHRLTDGGANVLTMDGYTGPCRALEAETTAAGALHLAGNNGPGSDIGVVLPDGGQARVLYEHRQGSWNSVEPVPGFVKENDFLTVWFDHGRCPQNARYAYILLPGASAKQTAAYEKEPDVKILACSDAVHAVRNEKTGLTGLHFWQETGGSCAGVAANAQASVMLKQLPGELRLAVSDPTKEDHTIELKLDCTAEEVLSQDEGVEILSFAPLSIRVNTTGADGRSLETTVRLTKA